MKDNQKEIKIKLAELDQIIERYKQQIEIMKKVMDLGIQIRQTITKKLGAKK